MATSKNTAVVVTEAEEKAPEGTAAPKAPENGTKAPEVVEEEPVIVTPTTKKARVKGTWTQYYGGRLFNFVDGQSYELPLEVFEYLKDNGNIYDTL